MVVRSIWLCAFARVAIAFCCASGVCAFAHDVGTPVDRVTACNTPTEVFHGRFRQSRIRCENTVQNEDEYGHRRGEPECETLPVANGPGMRGIVPAACRFVTGLPADYYPLRLPNRVISAVVALRDQHGFEVGTAVLVAPNVLLTAAHVEAAYPLVAVFDFQQSDRCPLADPDEEVSFLLTLNSRRELATLAASSAHDYMLLTLEPRKKLVGAGFEARRVRLANGCSLIQAHVAAAAARKCEKEKLWGPDCFGFTPLKLSAAAIAREPEMGARISILGFTRNVFYPRGQVSSLGGYLVPYAVPTKSGPAAQTSVHYNAQTAPTFSGGPVFDINFQMIALHTWGHSLLDEASAIKLKGFRDFARPNGGRTLKEILTHVAAEFEQNGVSPAVVGTDFEKVVRSFRQPLRTAEPK